ncbi:DNA replication/repair protein RecF [Sphingobium sp. AN641]|uniref:DNA replication/repair protein RecF n=1 Tax=Sphingobium sp. AN641 TaxID=3133443 RepID=UPI0030BE123A
MIGRLTLSDFRNHGDALIVPRARARAIVLTGDNGAGKTNILEAVSLLAPGRGLRGAALSAMPRQDGPGGFAVAAEVGGVMLGTGVLASAPDRRQVRIGGAASSANALAEHLSIIWLTPAMDRLFMDSPGGRRRFVDRLTLALHPSHAMHSARYEAAMRGRNRLLADPRRADPAWLSALEAQMGEHGAAIAAARAELVTGLNAQLERQPEKPFARPRLTLTGWTGDALAQRLASERRRDSAAGRTLLGPHRDDLDVLHVAKGQAAALCSTGEQKALLLSIILAHAALIAGHRGQPPVLLLDEIAAHLDAMRRAALFERLAGTGSQIWMTGTELSLFSGLADMSHVHITSGAPIGSAT